MKNVLRLMCGWMAIALAACTGDELQQIAPLQKPVGERVISVDAYTPSDDAHTRLDFEESTEGLKLSWSENDAFTAVIDNKEVTFSYDVNSEQFTATLPEGVALTDGIVAYYPAYTDEYSTDLSEQTGALNSAKTFMEGTYHAASNSFTFAHSTAILKATFSGLPQEAEVVSIKIGAAPYTISIPPTDGMNLAEGGIYIYLPNVAKNENVVFSVSTTVGAVYTATQAVKLDEGIKVGTYYVAPITLTPAACNLPTGNDFNTALNSFLQDNELTQIKFIANSVNTDNSNPIGSSNAYMVANGNVLEIHTAAPKFVFNEDSGGMFCYLSSVSAIDFGNNVVDTSNVENMSSMFSLCFVLTSLDLSSFDTSSVTDMSFMFSPNPQLTSLNVSSFDTSNVTNMNAMFSGCPKLTSLDLSNFDTSQVTAMNHMFSSSSALTSLDLSSFNTSNVTNMNNMFAVCNALTSLDLSNFNTSKVEDMSYMFAPCRALTSLDLSSFDTSKVTDMGRMFKECSSLTSLDLSNFDFSLVTNFTGMFDALGMEAAKKTIPVCVTLAGYNILKDAATGINDEYAKYVFPCELPLGGVINTKLKDYSSYSHKIKFVANSSITSGISIPAGSSTIYFVQIDSNGFHELQLHTPSPKFVFNANCNDMFKDLSNIITIDFGDNIDTSNVTYMISMFEGCSSLTSLDLSKFDTSNVESMNSMFKECRVLTSLDLSNFDTSKVRSMREMFYRCQALTSLSLSSFDTSNVTNMNNMFFACSSLTSLDLSGFDTSKVTNMSSMFFHCSLLTSLNLSSFDTSKVTSMNGMFYECTELSSLDLSSFNFSGVTDPAKFANMFYSLGVYATEKPIPVYVKNKDDKTLLENAGTGINSNYAKIMVKQP